MKLPSLSGAKNLAQLFFVCALSLAFGVACQTQNFGKLPDGGPKESASVLAPGDTIKVSFPNTPELNQSQRIRADGRVNLPLIGEVSAAGKSFSRLQTDLISAYKPQLKDAEVVVSLESTLAPTVVVAGAIRKGGTIPIEKPTTVFEAIMQSGGFAPEANLAKVQLFRIVKGEHRSEILDMRNAMSGAPTRVVILRDGDIIFVPAKTFNF